MYQGKIVSIGKVGAANKRQLSVHLELVNEEDKKDVVERHLGFPLSTTKKDILKSCKKYVETFNSDLTPSVQEGEEVEDVKELKKLESLEGTEL